MLLFEDDSLPMRERSNRILIQTPDLAAQVSAPGALDDGTWKELCRTLRNTTTDKASRLYGKVMSTHDRFMWGGIEWHEEHKPDSGNSGYFSPWCIMTTPDRDSLNKIWLQRGTQEFAKVKALVRGSWIIRVQVTTSLPWRSLNLLPQPDNVVVKPGGYEIAYMTAGAKDTRPSQEFVNAFLAKLDLRGYNPYSIGIDVQFKSLFYRESTKPKSLLRYSPDDLKARAGDSRSRSQNSKRTLSITPRLLSLAGPSRTAGAPTLPKSSRPGTKPETPKSPPGVRTASVTRISTPSGVSSGVTTASTPSADCYPSTKFDERIRQRSGESVDSLERPAKLRVLPLLRAGDGVGEVEGKGEDKGEDEDKGEPDVSLEPLAKRHANEGAGACEDRGKDVIARIAEKKLCLAKRTQKAEEKLADAEKEVEKAKAALEERKKDLEEAKAEEAVFHSAIFDII